MLLVKDFAHISLHLTSLHPSLSFYMMVVNYVRNGSLLPIFNLSCCNVCFYIITHWLLITNVISYRRKNKIGAVVPFWSVDVTLLHWEALRVCPFSLSGSSEQRRLRTLSIPIVLPGSTEGSVLLGDPGLCSGEHPVTTSTSSTTVPCSVENTRTDNSRCVSVTLAEVTKAVQVTQILI